MTSTDIHSLFAEGARLRQAGKLDEALPLYQRILAADPGNTDALHFLGLVALQGDDAVAAEELMRRAIAVNDREPAFHFHLAFALQVMGRLEEAVAGYRAALALKPDDAETYNNLGTALASQGKLEEAATSYRSALAVTPDNAQLLNNLGNVERTLGRHSDAERFYRNAIALNPGFAGALINLGKVLRDKGAHSESESCYRRALALEPNNCAALVGLGFATWILGRPEESVRFYQNALALDGNNVEALANLGNMLYEKGALEEAEAIYRRALELRPYSADLLNNYAGLSLASGRDGAAIDALRRSLAAQENPRAKFLFVELSERANWDTCDLGLGELMIRALSEPWDRPGRLARASAALIKRGPLRSIIARANAAWPTRLSAEELLGDGGLSALTQDALLFTLLTTAPNADMALERFLTLARSALTEAKPDEPTLTFLGALAQQCFINEYIFNAAPEELQKAGASRMSLSAMLDEQAEISPLNLLSAATYFPLHAIRGAERLLLRRWPAPVDAVLIQQIREPQDELRLGAQIPTLTPVTDAVSREVRQQYEENPYPRWVRIAEGQTAGAPAFSSIASFVRAKFPLAGIDRNPEKEGSDVLVAGCGTGQHSISSAKRFGANKLLAVDLSRASLSYAMRKSREMGLSIEYALGDILELGALDRRFDLIESIGVLHHMQDPFAAWRILLGLLKPGGFMRLGLYSAVARRTLVEARARIAERGLSSADIRIFRHELADQADGWKPILKSEDFFSVSAARDLMFHVKEHQLTLPRIAGFLKANNLDFLGFELPGITLDAYRARFPDDTVATNLGNWDIFENENPALFNRMYMFWVRTGD